MAKKEKGKIKQRKEKKYKLSSLFYSIKMVPIINELYTDQKFYSSLVTLRTIQLL